MSENNKKSRREELDDFWDLSSLVPQKNTTTFYKNSVDTTAVDIEDDRNSFQKGSKSTTSLTNNGDTVIKRYVNPCHYENKKIRRESFESTETYYPENSLLHKVTLKKRKSEYQLYSEFLEDAKRYHAADAFESPFEPYYSYVPQYNQLTSEQLNYYLWWRKCFKEGVLIKIDYSYILLYVFELINLGDQQDVLYAQAQLASLWNSYHKEYAALASKLATWICDFSLIHHLPMPTNVRNSIGKYVPALKEFFIQFSKGDYDGCARSLIKYCTEYNYHSSKFAKEPNLAVFEEHIFGAMRTAVIFYSSDEALLSKLSSEDSKLVRNSFEGALCVSSQRYEIEVKYSSFSRSNELRYIMGDIVKYSENKIRTYLGIKSKLSVYSVSGELQQAIDAYFENTLFSKPKISQKKQERQEYDALYDLPNTALSLEKAKQIEQDSWGVTKDLISAFEEDCEPPAEQEALAVHKDISAPNENTSLAVALEEYMDFIKSIKSHNTAKYTDFAVNRGKLIDGIIDEINEIAVEIIGDVLIEETDGGFDIIDCYAEMIN